MSVQYYDKDSGTLTTLASGSRVWTGTKAAYDAEKQAGTLPNNCIIVITDDEVAMDTVPTQNSPVAVTSDGIHNAFTEANSDLKDTTPTQNSNKPITSGGIYTTLNTKYSCSGVSDNTKSDPIQIIKDKWGTEINASGLWSIGTNYYAWQAFVFYYSSKYGAAIIFGYGDTMKYMRLFNTSWTTYNVDMTTQS